jgi:hypothetical protein
LIITAKKHDEFWQIAVPTYLTGVGTLALAVVNVILLRQEAADREALAAAQAERDTEEARREARKVVTTSERLAVIYEPQPEVIRVLNAGSEPIFDVRVTKASSKDGWPIERFWHWHPDTGRDATNPQVVLPNEQFDFAGNWRNEHIPDLAHPPEADRATLVASITWTDSRGRRWHRDGNALPEPVTARAVD